MAYSTNEKSTGLDVLTTLASGDLHIVGDVSDSGRAKAITEDNLETTIANSTNFTDALIANTTFTQGLANDDTFVNTLANNGTFITDLTNNSAFQTQVNNFVSGGGGGGGGGGTKLAIDTTAFSHTGDTTETTAYTVSIPAGTLGTNNAIRFYLLGSSNGNSDTVTYRVKYGASTVATIADTSGTNADLIIDGNITANASASAQVSSARFVKAGNVTESTDGTNSTEVSTGALNLVITVQNASAGATTSFKGIIVEKISSVVDGVLVSLTAAEDLTAGQPVGASGFVDEQVAKANYIARTVTGTVTADTSSFTVSEQVGTDKVVQAYMSGANLRTSVVSIDTATFAGTRGTEVLVVNDAQATGVLSYFDIAKLDTDKFIIFYARSTSTSIVRYKIGTISGTTITLTAEGTAFTSGSVVSSITACQVSTDKGFLAFTGSVDKAIAFTVSGTTPTFGTALTIDSNLTGPKVSTLIDTDKVALAGGGNGYCQIFTMSGTTLTGGTAVQYSSTLTSPTAQEMSITSPATDVLVIGYEDKSNAATVSGTVPTFGTEIQDAGTNPASKSVVAKSSSVIWVTYDGVAKVLTLSGNALTDTSKEISDFIGSAFQRSILLNMGTYITAINAGVSSNVSQIYVEGMTNNVIGIAQNTVSQGASVSVLLHGVDSNQSGLTAGRIYEASSGSLAEVGSGSAVYTAGKSPTFKAISATKIII